MKIKLQYIQFLRALGAILVVGFHAKAQLNGVFGMPLGAILFQAGSVGVPIFFAISGFIIVYTTKNNTENDVKSIEKFLLKRVLRIAPMYYVFTFLWIFCFFKME